MTRYKIIINPISGRGNGEKSYPIIENAMHKHGLDFEMARTEYPGHAIQLAEEASASGFDVVVAAGGDGTSNEVVNGLLRAGQNGGRQAGMGVLGIGRGNDFAFAVDAPVDVEAACRSLAQGRRKWIDVGVVYGGDYPEGRYFDNGLGIGFDAVVGFEALKLKRLSGFPSYIVAALKTIFLYFQAPTLNIEFNGQTLTQASLMVSVMNGRRAGGGFMMAPESVNDDGLFDLCIAAQVSRAAIFGLIIKFMQGAQVGHPAIRMERAAEVKISAVNGSIPAHIDGETLCHEGDQIEAKILPKALEVIVPQGDAS